MKKTFVVLIALSFCVMLSVLLSDCKTGSNDTLVAQGPILAEDDVTILPGGGGSEVPIFADSGLTIRITMTASDNSMQPYGYLEYPGGSGEYHPSQDTAQNGTNTAVVTLPQAGFYQLIVFDGTSTGGTVHVKVEII